MLSIFGFTFGGVTVCVIFLFLMLAIILLMGTIREIAIRFNVTEKKTDIVYDWMKKNQL